MKSQRQAKILEIISNKNIETQEQLLAELQAEGFRGTQATISRDIKELRIVKELTAIPFLPAIGAALSPHGSIPFSVSV